MEDDFPKLSERWFTANGTTDPVDAAQLWADWNRPGRTASSRYRKALLLATGLSPGAIRHYLNGRLYKLSETTLARLDALSLALGMTPPARKERPYELIRDSLVERRIALLTELTAIPSLAYHMAIIHSLVQAATDRNFIIALHAVSRPNLAADVQQILQHYRPSAVVMVRLTPDATTVETLAKWALPAILIHADRRRYPCPPVLANILPAQHTLETPARAWAAEILAACGKTNGEVIVVAMPDEEEQTHFGEIEAGPCSVRAQRKAILLRALREFDPILIEVEDYSFRHALPIVQRYPNARLYVCLSDEIAVGIKHLLTLLGQNSRHCVLGFDDSLMARTEGISSIEQSLSEIGAAAIEPLTDWYRRMEAEEEVWPEFREVEVKVRLVMRD